MMCYKVRNEGGAGGDEFIPDFGGKNQRFGKANRACFGERQLSGCMGKSLYLRCQAASCFWKSLKE